MVRGARPEGRGELPAEAGTPTGKGFSPVFPRKRADAGHQDMARMAMPQPLAPCAIRWLPHKSNPVLANLEQNLRGSPSRCIVQAVFKDESGIVF